MHLIGCPRCDMSAKQNHAIYCPNEDCKYYQQTYSQICNCGEIDWEEYIEDDEVTFFCNVCHSQWKRDEFEDLRGVIFGDFENINASVIMALQECKTVCNKLIVGVKSSGTNKFEDRYVLLRAIKYVDSIFMYDNDDALKNCIADRQPDIIFATAEGELITSLADAVEAEIHFIHPTSDKVTND